MGDREQLMFIKFLEIETKKIDIDKWDKGIEIKCDPGQEYIQKWIEENASDFRNRYNLSSCKVCKKWQECGVKLVLECVNFEDEAI